MSNEQEWQPIETAPKDGTWILTYTDQGWHGPDVTTWIVQWHSGKWCWFDQDDIVWDAEEPTHWMPLPKPPAEQDT